MNKKLNTFCFLVIATILNLVMLAVLAVVLLLFFELTFRNIEEVSQGLSLLAIIVILSGSIGGSFLLYSRIMKWAAEKWNLENYLTSMFKSGRKH